MIKTVKLKEIVNIRSGVVIPKTVNNDIERLTNTFVTLINTSDFTEDLKLRNDLVPNAVFKPSLEKNYIKKNEILFNAKGRRFFAARFNEEYNYTVASSTFLILSPTDELYNNILINLDYIVWYLNHPLTLRKFEVKMSSQTMPAVTKQELEELEIKIPSLDEQENIIQVDRLMKKEIGLLKELIQVKEDYINNLTYNKIQYGN